MRDAETVSIRGDVFGGSAAERIEFSVTDTEPTGPTELIDLGAGVEDRYLVTGPTGPTASVEDVLEGRSGTILYHGPCERCARALAKA